MTTQPKTSPKVSPRGKKPEDQKEETKKEVVENLDDLQLSDMDDEDLILDDPMAFIERQASQQNDVNTMFVDDSDRAGK